MTKHWKTLVILVTAIPVTGLSGLSLADGPVICWGFGTTSALVDEATAIAAGGVHSCAIQAETGNIICWGSGYPWGQTIPPPSVDGTTGTASAAAAGQDHSCAIQAVTGNVICWGERSEGITTPPPSVNGTTGTAIAIAAGSRHSCAIQRRGGRVANREAETGNVVWWGVDYSGQATPPPSVDGTMGTASAVAAGAHHSCAIQAETGNFIHSLPGRQQGCSFCLARSAEPVPAALQDS